MRVVLAVRLRAQLLEARGDAAGAGVLFAQGFGEELPGFGQKPLRRVVAAQQGQDRAVALEVALDVARDAPVAGGVRAGAQLPGVAQELFGAAQVFCAWTGGTSRETLRST